MERSGRGGNRRRDRIGYVEPRECVVGALGTRSVFLGRSGSWGRDRCRRWERNRVAAVLGIGIGHHGHQKSQRAERLERRGPSRLWRDGGERHRRLARAGKLSFFWPARKLCHLGVDANPTAILDLAVRDLSLHAWDRYTRRCCDRVARVTRWQCLVPSAYALRAYPRLARRG